MPPLHTLLHRLVSYFLRHTLHAQHRVCAFPHPAHLLFTEPPSPCSLYPCLRFQFAFHPFSSFFPSLLLSLFLSPVSLLFLLRTVFSLNLSARRLGGRGVCNRNLYKENTWTLGPSYPTRVRSSREFFAFGRWREWGERRERKKRGRPLPIAGELQ